MRNKGFSAPLYTGTSAPQSSTVYSALRVACCTFTLPATVVMAATRTSEARSAMMRATASSDAVSVSIKNVRGTRVAYQTVLVFVTPARILVARKKEVYSYTFSSPCFPKENRLFTPSSLNIALLMMITSAVCWGSWANTYKGVQNYRFELFYWDYAIGIFLISLVLALTMGSTGHDASSFLDNVRSADPSNIVSTLIGGAIFNLANLLLVAAIDMAGLAVAFPVSIGIALVVGVVLNYILQPKGSALLLASGVACALIAVILDGKAYGNLKRAGSGTSRKSIILCVVSGTLMGLW